MNASHRKTDDPALAALLHDYIALYARDTLERWRQLFLPEFVASSVNDDGSVTVWDLDAFFERQRSSFGTYALHGVDPASLRLLCVKAKNHFRAAFAQRCAAIIDCDAPGPACVDLSRLPFRNARSLTR
jgi:microcystin degradation protein MlrC